jgi:hypothetical protein
MPKNTKNNIFKDEQIEIKKKLLQILKIDANKNYFTLFELDSDIELQNRIFELENDCDKYFATSTWTYFKYKRDGKISNRPYLLMIRNILNATNTIFLNKVTTLTIEKNKYQTTKYIIY